MAMRTRRIQSLVTVCSAAAVLLCTPRPAAAQLDPLLFLKNAKPNVIVAIDTSARMRVDADGTYYDPAEYVVTGASWESAIGVTGGMTKYRRKFSTWTNTSVVTSSLTAATSNISIVGDTDAKYAYFSARTRLALVRAAVTQAINENTGVARFGLVKTRQAGAAIPGASNATVTSSGAGQSSPTEDGLGTWRSRLATVTTDNGLQLAQLPVVLTDAAGSNSSIVSVLSKSVTDAGALVPAGNDTATKVDAPVNYILVDAKTESSRLIAADTDCRNTIVVLIVGGGEGSGTSGTNDPAATASQFLAVGGRRVPVYVVAIAPPAAEVAQLQNIAKNSGGQYFEITKAMIDAAYDSWLAGVPAGSLAGQPAGTIVVPEIVRAVNTAVQHAFPESRFAPT